MNFLAFARVGALFALLSIVPGCAALVGPDSRAARLEEDGVFRYPAAAKAARVGGRVEVQFAIDENGRVRDARVVSADPAGVFDEAALAYVSARRYLPAVQDGRPVPTPLKRETIRFALADAGAELPEPPKP